MKISREYWGIVSDGIGSSNKWMPKYLPNMYPGTLNIKLEEDLNFYKNPRIAWEKEFVATSGNIFKLVGKPGMSPEPLEKKFGRVAFCQINGINAYLINPPMVGLDRKAPYAEIGSKENLREKLELKNGDRVSLKFYIK